MSQKTALVVDDSSTARLLLSKVLRNIGMVCREAVSGEDALKQLGSYKPDFIFLDHIMPGIDGFGVVEKIQSDIVPLVVFTTAYEQYALDAFDVHAVDYILKPLDAERIERAVKRAEERLALEGESDNKHSIIGAIDSINTRVESEQSAMSFPAQSAEDKLERKVVIKEKDDITLLKQAEIEWIDAAGDYVCLHVDGVTHIKRSTLKSLLGELDPEIFKRVHRSTIVNLNFIEKNKDEAFFAVLSFNAVHTPMQAPEADIKKFNTGDSKRDILLAMLHRMDVAIGNVVDTLKES